MQAIWTTAWKGKFALHSQDLITFGELMTKNHKLVNQMMKSRFSEGAGEKNNLIINFALEHGALGAKLTGAGGGGSVYALTNPGEEKPVKDIWEEIACDLSLSSAYIFKPQISHHGLIVENGCRMQSRTTPPGTDCTKLTGNQS